MTVRSWPIRPDHRLTAHVVAGRYRLDDLLGRGGAADVYEGLDLRLRRPVAVKVFRPDGDADTEQRFDGEGRLLAQLQHPGLITVYDCGRDEGTPYLVMELIRGTTLRRRIARSRLTPAEACRIGAALAAALAHVHAAGVVHRDVKPANILLDESGAPHLTDFGISRLLDTTAHTVTGTLVGTAAYMAPEQVLGRGAGPAADIYSLGLVLLEALKGELEYDGMPLEAAIARLHRPPVVPPHIPGPLAGLLDAMTDADETRRPDAAACGRALAAAAVECESAPGHEGPAAPSARPARTEGAGPLPPAPSGRRPAARRAGRALLSAGAAVAMLGVGLTGSLGDRAAGGAQASSRPPRPVTAEPSAPAERPAPSPAPAVREAAAVTRSGAHTGGGAADGTITDGVAGGNGDAPDAPGDDAPTTQDTPTRQDTPDGTAPPGKSPQTRTKAATAVPPKGKPGKGKPAKGKHRR
ncbi:protein kinase [Streptomyces sp. NPDC015131]|uniref:serine/threonine-protein kinase n=1 Tax=Streptomyces sp. NPDC015131 TaxID=3364941 RepID=UPI0036FF4576